MLNITVTDLEKPQRKLEDAQRASESLNGTIAALSFNPDVPGSVEQRQMEAAVEVSLHEVEWIVV